jgi:hypothetical protein
VSSRLEIKLARDGSLQDVRLDGRSLWPIWFKVEWKGDGELGAKIAGNRLSTRQGDEIRFLVESGDAISPQEEAVTRSIGAGQPDLSRD